MGVLIVLSAALTLIGGMAWWRKRARRLLMVTIAFFLFVLKGLALAGGLYLLDIISVPRSFAWTFDMMLLLDVMVLMTLYLALFRKG